MKKRSVKNMKNQSITQGLWIYILALVLILIGGLVPPSAWAQGSGWDQWDGRDPRRNSSLPGEALLTPEEKRIKIKAFPFLKEAIRFRLNQSFFNIGTEAFEEILKSMGVLDPKSKTLKFMVANVDPRNQKPVKDTSWIQYKYLKSKVQLRRSGLSISLDTQVVDAIIQKPKWNATAWGGGIASKCLIRMRGKLQLVVDAHIDENKEVVVSIPKMNNQSFQMAARGCDSGVGETLTSWAVNQFGPGQLQSGLQEVFNQILNSEEGTASFGVADLGKEINEKGIFVNAPSIFKASQQVKNNFRVELGVAGTLSNANGSMNLRIQNPKNEYLNDMGFEWVLSSGFKSLTKNILGIAPDTTKKSYQSGFLGWGVAPFQKSGEKVNFDAAVSVSEAYVGALFSALFNSGFFNWQVANEAATREYKISPLELKALFEEKLSNGQILNEENHEKSRLEMQMLAPPSLGLQTDQTIVATVPRFRLAYLARIKGVPQDEVLLDFESKFRLKAKLVFTEDAKFKIDFSENPVVDFQLLNRQKVAAAVTDAQLFDALNKEVMRVLSSVEVDIPLLKGRKLEITYLGIDGSEKSGKSLSVYLKVSSLKDIGEGGVATKPLD